jgi:triosephosphate isomerase
MKKKLIVGNWKLNPATLAEAKSIVLKLNKVRGATSTVVICPPYVYLGLLKSKFALGVQDLFWEEKGAFTGQISAPMLKQFKVKYAIIGHSELRELGESDHEINLKMVAALGGKITPILCVGFGLTADMNEEDILFHLQTQLENGLRGIDPDKVVVAYEPLWAIGSGHPADPEHTERVAMFIKIKYKVSKVLYGGSTNAENAQSFLKKTRIDGLLVGGASLDAEAFSKIISI